jgi:outer membrane protein TolC
MAVGLCLVAAAGVAQSPSNQAASDAQVELVQPGLPGQPAAPVTITFQDALERARKVDPTAVSATVDAKIAHEDRVQARAALLPSVSATTQYLGTQGDGVFPSGRYVTNDGVHVYRQWGVFRQDLSPGTFMMTGYELAAAGEALAKAKAEIAQRGLTVTVTKTYYALVVAMRKYATAQESLEQAKRFLAVSQDREKGGEAAHSDVIKAQIQFEQQKQNFEEARLGMEAARLSLAVLIFPTLNENFTVVDDLQTEKILPAFDEIRTMAEQSSPDVRAAMQAVRQTKLDVTAARTAFLPSLGVDTDYGIEANAFALKSRVSADPLKGRMPNVGYFVTATLNLPVWDWGTLRSKLRQAQYRREESTLQLSFAQREVMSNLYEYYNEAMVARAGAETLRDAARLAAESLRLTGLRYQAGEATMLEVVDAQNTLAQARNASDDGQVRYRVALANLQTLTGEF